MLIKVNTAVHTHLLTAGVKKRLACRETGICSSGFTAELMASQIERVETLQNLPGRKVSHDENVEALLLVLQRAMLHFTR